VNVIRTRRLVLRRFQPGDRAAYLAIRSEPAVARALGYEPELAVAKTDWFFELNDRSWSERGFGAWLVCRDGEPIGHAGLWYVDAFDAVEILYAYAERAWGAGIATEAGTAVVDVAFDSLGLASLIALVAPDNVRSRRVVEKLGFRATRNAEHRGTPVIVHERERTARA
jgi:ribosomal-protein-alanine N-acetyltransferase